MKVKYRWKQWIAIILVIALSLSSVPMSQVQAETNVNGKGIDVLSSIRTRVEHKAETIKEGKIDSKAVVSAGNWYVAIKIDHLSWNFFHNAIQEDIANNEDYANVSREFPIDDKWEDGKPTGKPGRADLAMMVEKKTYLWEIKPWSYSVEDEKKKSASKQLQGYVDSNKEYERGGKQIKNGTVTREVTNVKEDYIEEVTYTIEYCVEDNGLIFYKFKRSAKKKEKEKVEEKKKYPIAIEEKDKAIEDMTTVKVPVKNPAEKLDRDPVQIALMIGMATGWKSFNDAINSNPHTANSASAAIAEGCAAFLAIIVPAMANPEEANAAEVNQAIDDFETLFWVFNGDEYTEMYIQALSENDDETLEELLKLIQGESDAYEKAGEAQPPRDPLIIDLGEKGIKLHNVKNGVNFDLDNNGFAEKTAWIDIEDGFLALDRNGNGKIDNGGELFGDQVILQDGKISASGFEALGELDENHDQVIDQEDSAFSSLLVWIDADHNGKSKSEELHTLDELKIVSISLEHEENSVVDEETGARLAESAKVIIRETEDTVSETEISEFWFPVNTSDTTHGGTVTAGNVPNLDTAIREDETGTLDELCCNFAESDDIAYKRFCTKEILYYLTDASDLKPNSRGGNIDARDLKVIEAFMGRKFEGVGGTNPNVNAAQLLKEIYGRIEDDYYNILNQYSKFGTYLKIVSEYQDENGETKLNCLPLNSLIQSKIGQGENADTLIYDFGMYLRAYDQINGTTYYAEFCKEYSEISDHCKEIVNLSGSGTTYIGTAGNDTYVFDVGYGADTVIDSEGINTLSFGSMITLEKLQFERTNWNNLTITFAANVNNLTRTTTTYSV